MNQDRSSGHAIVVGASVAGLSHAAALRRHFSLVTVLEADLLDIEKPMSRKGSPQDKQAHGLLNRGLTNLEEFLPGFHQQLLDSGVAEFEYGRDVAWYMMGTWWSQVPSGIKAIGFTRPNLEFVLRRRLMAEKNIKLRSATTVTNYLTEDNGTRVCGVEFKDGASGELQTLRADLIVDCTGRHSHTVSWLENQGYGQVTTEEVEIDVFYRTQLVRLSKPTPWKFVYNSSSPPDGKRMGVLIQAEGDTFVFGIGGYLGEIPPRDFNALHDYLRGLSSPALAQLHHCMIPVSEPSTMRFKSNMRRHFARMEKLPDGLLFGGDVVCSFDPVFGQGMTTATLSATVLDRCLKRRKGKLERLTKEFHKAQAKVLDEAWIQALANDLRFPEVQAKRPLKLRFMMAYTGLVLQAMHLPWVHNRVVPVFNMMKSPLTFFNPLLIFAAVMVKLGMIQPDKAQPVLILSGTSGLRAPENNINEDAML